MSRPHPDPHKRMGQILSEARDAFAKTGAGEALTLAGQSKVRALRQTITDQMGQISDLQDLLALALPYVEAAQDDEAHDAGGKARARALAAKIREAVK